MLSRNDSKLIRSLAQKKYRDATHLFVAEGEKLVAEALRSGYEVVRVFRTEEIGAENMERISMLSSPSPVLALIRKPAAAPLQPAQGELMLALDSLRDPGNVGTILRLADWFGIHTLLVSRDTVDLYNPKVVQATMGALFRVRVHEVDLPETLAVLRSDGWPVYGTFLSGDSLYEAPLTPGGVLVMGSERDGISPEVAAQVTARLHIPSYPPGATGSESLNVATATAILCSEFRRRTLIR